MIDTASSKPVVLNGSCHCGAVKFALTLTEGYASARRCTCSICGIYTHHKRRSNPGQLGVNVACIEGISPFDFSEVIVFDGERHPSDNAEHKTYVAGVLRFDPAP